MKVKCLDSGSQAHLDSAKVFEYKEGENIDGLSEETAISMRDAGHCEILMNDEEEEPAPAPAREPAPDSGGSDDAGTKSESSDTSNENGSNSDAPWKNNGE